MSRRCDARTIDPGNCVVDRFVAIARETTGCDAGPA